MLGKPGQELDRGKLDILCQERNLQRQQKTRNEINGKLAHIERGCPSSLEVDMSTRPYGVEHEGAAYHVWHYILEHVNDPLEIKNLWNVSAMFRDILRRKYIETRLPEMIQLQIILDKRPKYMLPDRSKVFDTMRLVSKQCKISVDSICRSHKRYTASLDYDVDATEKVQRVCEMLEENTSFAASLFPLVDFTVDEFQIEGLEDFRQAVRYFLVLAGHKIREFTYYSSLVAPLDFYNRLRDWASLLPNVEHLTFGRNYDEYAKVAIALEDIQPFPIIPTLQCIEEADTVNGLTSPFIQRILEACPGIQDLQLNQADHVREHLPQVLANFTTLTSLRICAHRSLLLHRNLPWKLKKLVIYREDHLRPRKETTKATISSCRLFSFLKQFEETLEHLEFEMVDFTEGCGYLDLRNLKTLDMELHDSYHNLNFLLYAESLETLMVRIGNEFMWALSPEETFCKVISGSFLGKSLWEVFPYLKRLQLSTEGYSEWNGRVNGAKFEEFRKISF